MRLFFRSIACPGRRHQLEARSGSSSHSKCRWSSIRKTKNHQQLLPEATSIHPTHESTLNPMSSSTPRGSPTPRAKRPTPRTQCPTPRAQHPTPRTRPSPRAKCVRVRFHTNTPLIRSYTKLSLAFRPNPDPMPNSSSPKPSTFEAPL